MTVMLDQRLMLPLDIVQSRYELPVAPFPFQAETINGLAPLPRAGYYLDVGTGKTITSIVAALFKLITGQVSHVVVLMPPVLVTNWARTLAKIPGVTYTCYRGERRTRAQMRFDAQFTLMGYQIFKRDWDFVCSHYFIGDTLIICDEAKAIKNVGSQTHRRVHDFAEGNHVMLLEGTPLNFPTDGYAYIKTVAPEIYPSLYVFEKTHVYARDVHDKPIEFKNLDLLAENLKVNSVRILKRDVLQDLPPITYTPLFYDLAPQHQALYRELADVKVKELAGGDKIDVTNATALFYALQQIPCNAEFFSGGDVKSTVLDLIDETMEELAGDKLVVYTRYRMTNRRLLETCQKYGVVSVYGEVAEKQKQAAIDRFIADPGCRMIVLQTEAGGAGIDGLQTVCNNGLFIEMPTIAGTFHQACGRLDRAGQKNPVNMRVAIATKTLQKRVFEMCLDNDSLVNICIRGPRDLRNAIFGD